MWLGATRSVGAANSQTPIWRKRQEAKVARFPLERRKALQLDYFGYGPARPAQGASAEELADSAFQAVLRGSELEAAQLTWAIKELPRDAAVKEAVNRSRGEEPRTLLQEASAAGFQRPVSYLLEMQASVAPTDQHGRTALHLAAVHDHPEVVRLLLLGRAPVNSQDINGCTALHLAAQKGLLDVGRVLVRFQADFTLADKDNNTPLSLAQAPERLACGLAAFIEERTAERLLMLQKMNRPWDRVVQFGKELNSHIRAPPLVVVKDFGFLPLNDDGTVRQLKRPVMSPTKRRRGLTIATGVKNWYAMRG